MDWNWQFKGGIDGGPRRRKDEEEMIWWYCNFKKINVLV